MQVIGITGGIASGKTSVSSYIRKKGFKVYDCDKIAHDVFLKENVKNKIIAAFNLSEKEYTRSTVASIVFKDKEKLDTLNSIMKDEILLKMKEIIKGENGLIFFDVPLLYDWHLEDIFEKRVFVYVDKENQIARLEKRDNIDKEFAINKISAQIDIEEKKKIAEKNNDYIIDNNQDEDALYQEVDKFLRRIIA